MALRQPGPQGGQSKRRPIAPNWHRYERMKQQFRQDRPDATPAEYNAAMLEFARLCGV